MYLFHNQVKVITSVEDQKRILEACHCDPTSGHFGITKTWKRISERFYWKALSKDVKELVRVYKCFELFFFTTMMLCT